jgi:hypothetical protein
MSTATLDATLAAAQVLEGDPANPVNPDAAPAPVLDEDVDAIALREAQQELEAEKAPAAPPNPETPASPAPAAAAEPAPGQQPVEPNLAAAPKDQPMIPKARLDEKIMEAAHWKGVAEGLLAAQKAATTQPAAEPTPAAPPVKTPEQRLADIDARKVDLAKQFDAGAIDAAAWKEQEIALDREARSLLLEAAKPTTAPAQTPGEDLYLDELTAKLEDDHPYTKLIPASDRATWNFIEQKAVATLAEQGVTLAPRADGTLDARSAYALRKTMAELTDTLGPALTGKTLPAAAAQAPGAQPQTPPAGPSATAQARADKLALAANHPPDVSALGRAQGGTATVTDADISQMSDEEIAALPSAVRARFLQTS